MVTKFIERKKLSYTPYNTVRFCNLGVSSIESESTLKITSKGMVFVGYLYWLRQCPRQTGLAIGIVTVC
jgi:hypothetical protein